MTQNAMPQRSASRAVVVLIILLAGIVLAIANVGVLLFTMPRPPGNPIGVSSLLEMYRVCPPCSLYFVAAPVVIVILLAIVIGRRSVLAGAQPAAVTAPTSAAAPALRLLAVLQQEGRFIDFITEDIDSYSDAQVGAATRSIHAGCRKALTERIELERIFAAEDGSTVEVGAEFDRAAVRLTGNVAGAPPFRGTLQHGGWRARKVTLPESPGDAESTVIAPAEVEIS